MPIDYPDFEEGAGRETADTSTATMDTPPPRITVADTGRFAQSLTQPKKQLPELTVENAYRTLQFFQANPRYLANPYTRHAAESVFGAASKVIGMHTQLERVNATVEAAQARSGIARDVGRNLLKMQMMGGEAARIAARWNALGEDGKPLWQDSTHWQAILADSDAIDKQKADEEQRKQDLRTQGQIQVGEARHENRLSEIEAAKKVKATGNYEVQEFDGHKFLTGPNFKPISLNALTPEKKIEAQESLEDLRSLRRLTEKETDPIEKKKLLERQANVRDALHKISRATASTSPDAAAAPTNAPAASSPADKVHVLNPDGTKGFIPASQKDAALQQGYKVIP